jgi:general L-amino acid transport system substrate-binding protein
MNRNRTRPQTHATRRNQRRPGVRRAGLGLALGLGALLLSITAQAGTVEDVRERGMLRCGVNGEVPGMSLRDDAGNWSGLDVDFCRAVATAVLGDPEAVALVPLGAEDRFGAVRGGKVDLLARNTSWTGLRDITEGISFVGVLYFDGQGFMVPRKTNKLSALELDRTRVCVIDGTTSVDNAKRYFALNRMALELMIHPNLATAAAAYLDGKCDALTTDRSQLFALRATLDDSAAQRILPEVVSKELLGPVVRNNDRRWFDLVRWTLFTLVEAEELGIDSGNVVGAKNRAKSDRVRALLDLDGTTASALGVEPAWGYRVIRRMGNYGEMFERNLGVASGLGIKRGVNALWSDGGLMFAPPSR